MCCRAYKQHSEELSQEEEEEVGPDHRVVEHQAVEDQHHLPMSPNNQHNPLKMLK